MKKKEKLKEIQINSKYGIVNFENIEYPNTPMGDSIIIGSSPSTGTAHAGQTDKAETTYGWQHSTNANYTNWERTDTIVYWEKGDVTRYYWK
jgi:hypothetical protein